MWNDLVFSLRALRRDPLITGVALLSLALGIGANTAIFSLLQQVVLRSLPVQDPELLVVLHRNYSPPGESMSDAHGSAVFSYPLYRDLRDRGGAFSGLVARTSASVRLAWRGSTEGERVEIVSGNFFQTMGVPAAAGRVLRPDDDRADANPVVVLRHGYWLARFGGSRDILNQTVSVNGHPMVVVGVAAAGFNGLLQGQSPAVFVPIAAQRSVMPTMDALKKRSVRWLNLFARLAPGVTVARAQSVTDGVYRSLMETELAGMGPLRNQHEAALFRDRRVELPAIPHP